MRERDLVWSTKYRHQVLKGDVRLRVREIIRQVCGERGVTIVRGVLSSDHVHMFVSVPPRLAISDLVRLMKGRSSHKAQREFPHLKKRYWGRRSWGRGYFSTTNGVITEDIVLQNLAEHIQHPTGASR
ncbi:MAG: IS200/IS605 family transposase [Pseudomonadota bacterium]